jgi:transketolase
VARVNVSRGAYVLSDESDFEAIMIATGSEVMTAYRAVEQLRQAGRRIRFVSMPSWELFQKQSPEYRESVLPQACTRRIAVEAGTTFGWERFSGVAGLRIGIDHFGASAPYKVLAQKYGFTTEAIAARTRAYLDA